MLGRGGRGGGRGEASGGLVAVVGGGEGGVVEGEVFLEVCVAEVALRNEISIRERRICDEAEELGWRKGEEAHLVVHVDNDVVSRVAARHLMYRSSVLAESLLNSNLSPYYFFPCLAVCVASSVLRYQIHIDRLDEPLGQLALRLRAANIVVRASQAPLDITRLKGCG